MIRFLSLNYFRVVLSGRRMLLTPWCCLRHPEIYAHADLESLKSTRCLYYSGFVFGFELSTVTTT